MDIPNASAVFVWITSANCVRWVTSSTNGFAAAEVTNEFNLRSLAFSVMMHGRRRFGQAFPRNRFMLVRVVYASRAVGPQTTTVTASILSTAQAQNRKHQITGVLCQGDGLYIQVLEGERSAVNHLYGRIISDRRHKDVEMLHLEEITRRKYPDWSMALVNLSDHDPMVQMKHPEFDPFSATGAFMVKFIDELIASGRPIVPPAD